jgi:diguanylate cyclase (GGDEF)-like protein/PAS domain S-box-containing protein
MKKPLSRGRPSGGLRTRSRSFSGTAGNGLRRREAILEAVSFAAEKFVKAVSWESNIQDVIRRLGRAADVNRICIFKKETSPEGQILGNILCEWDAPGISSQINNPAFKSFSPLDSGFGRWIKAFSQGKPICGRAKDFPLSEQKMMESMDIKSIIAVPIFVLKELWGFIGFSECRREREWTAAEIDALQAAATILGGAIENEQFRSSLASSERQLRAMFEGLSGVILELDKEGRYLKVAPTNAELLTLPAEQLVGRRLHDIFPPEQVDIFLGAIRQSLQTKKSWEGEYSLPVGPQRSVAWFAATISPLTEDTVVLVARDITARKKAEEALKRSEERFRGLVENMIEGIYQTTPDGQILAGNPALVRLLGFDSEEDLRAVQAEEFYAHPEQRQVWIDRMARDGEIRSFESVFKRRDGSLIVVEDNARAIRGPDGRVFCFEGTLTDITDRKRLEDQLHWLANRDSLTNLFNRRRFHEDLQQQINQTRRYKQELALLWLDLDRFKDINDSLGHRAGDELLVEIALLLQDKVRKADILARLGGDEFAVLMPHTEIREAETAAARILEAIREHSFRLEQQPVRITASMGIALYPEHGDSVDKLLGHADLAMYRAKEQGRDRFSLESSSKLRTEAQEYRQVWTWLLDRDFDEKRFFLYAQPVYDLGRGTLSHHDLLLRLITDSGLVVSAESLLNLGHRFNVVKDIDHWVVRKAMRLLGQQKSGPKRILKISLSGRSLIDRELAVVFEKEREGLDPSSLMVGISELATISEFPRAQQFFNHLDKLGYQCVLDDFGAGLASLQHLRLLNLDVLKIDNSLVQNLSVHRPQRDLVKAIVQLAHSLGLKTLVSGVDEETSRDLLRELGVDLAQGFFLGLPQPLDKVFA